MSQTQLANNAVFVPQKESGVFNMDPTCMTFVTDKTVFTKGDFVKVTVGCGNDRTEKFWCEYVEELPDGLHKMVVNNDLVLTHLHGLADGGEVIVPREMLSVFMDKDALL